MTKMSRCLMKTIAMQRICADWPNKNSKKKSTSLQIRKMRLTITMKKLGRVKIQTWTLLTLRTKVEVTTLTVRRSQSRSPARKPFVPKSKMRRESVLKKLR